MYCLYYYFFFQIQGTSHNPGLFKKIIIIGDNRLNGVSRYINNSLVRPYVIVKDGLKLKNIFEFFKVKLIHQLNISDTPETLVIFSIGFYDLISYSTHNECLNMNHEPLEIPHIRTDKSNSEIVKSFIKEINEVRFRIKKDFRLDDSTSFLFTNIFPACLDNFQKNCIIQHDKPPVNHRIAMDHFNKEQRNIQTDRLISIISMINRYLENTGLTKIKNLPSWNIYEEFDLSMKDSHHIFTNGYDLQFLYMEKMAMKIKSLCEAYGHDSTISRNYFSNNKIEKIKESYPFENNIFNSEKIYKRIIFIGDSWLTSIENVWPKGDIYQPIFEIHDDLNLTNITDKLFDKYPDLSKDIVFISFGLSDLVEFKNGSLCTYHEPYQQPLIRSMLKSREFLKEKLFPAMNSIYSKIINKLHAKKVGFLGIYPIDLRSYEISLLEDHKRKTKHVITDPIYNDEGSMRAMTRAARYLNDWIYDVNTKNNLPILDVNSVLKISSTYSYVPSYILEDGIIPTKQMSEKVAIYLSSCISQLVKDINSRLQRKKEEETSFETELMNRVMSKINSFDKNIMSSRETSDNSSEEPSKRKDTKEILSRLFNENKSGSFSNKNFSFSDKDNLHIAGGSSDR